MKSTRPSQFTIESFSASFRRHVRLLIAWGLELAMEQIRSSDKEEEITGFLADSIDEILNSYRENWCKHYDVHNERPISSGGRSGNSRREIDLIIKFVTSPYKPEYVFEAKPLNYGKPHQREANYIDHKGVQRFLRGEYAIFTHRYPEVGMMGYVLTDSIEVWRERLMQAMTNNSSSLRLTSLQATDLVVNEFPLEWFTEHERESSDRPVRVCHLLLNCR
jgi:hypothetical protein